jgi:hypothetical protein
MSIMTATDWAILEFLSADPQPVPVRDLEQLVGSHHRDHRFSAGRAAVAVTSAVKLAFPALASSGPAPEQTRSRT